MHSSAWSPGRKGHLVSPAPASAREGSFLSHRERLALAFRGSHVIRAILAGPSGTPPIIVMLNQKPARHGPPPGHTSSLGRGETQIWEPSLLSGASGFCPLILCASSLGAGRSGPGRSPAGGVFCPDWGQTDLILSCQRPLDSVASHQLLSGCTVTGFSLKPSCAGNRGSKGTEDETWHPVASLRAGVFRARPGAGCCPRRWWPREPRAQILTELTR